jgi:hypothetical protein
MSARQTNGFLAVVLSITSPVTSRPVECPILFHFHGVVGCRILPPLFTWLSTTVLLIACKGNPILTAGF